MKKTISMAIVALFIALASFGQTDIYKSVKFGTSIPVSSSISINHNQITDNSLTDRTFEVWAKRDTFLHTDAFIYMAAGNYPSTPSLLYAIRVNYNTLTCNSGLNAVNCTYPLDTDWHHIAFICDTFDTDSITLSAYIDGVFAGGLRDKHSHAQIQPSFTLNQVVGSKFSSTGIVNEWVGNLCNFVIADSILYTSTFVPDCVFDISPATWTGGSIKYPYITYMPLTTDEHKYYSSYITTDTILLTSCIPYLVSSSPCAPSYSFYMPALGPDSITLIANQLNASYKKGAHMSAHNNGWSGVSTPITYGTFSDSMNVSAYISMTYPYTNDYNSTIDTAVVVIAIDTTTSINNVYNINDIKVYPNPSTGNFNVVVSDPVSLVIYDMTGHIVHTSNVTDKTMIYLSTGMYICTTTNKITNKVSTAKILIQ